MSAMGRFVYDVQESFENGDSVFDIAKRLKVTEDFVGEIVKQMRDEYLREVNGDWSGEGQ
jgi:Mn-dependent DtxR family transcriptional regulator